MNTRKSFSAFAICLLALSMCCFAQTGDMLIHGGVSTGFTSQPSAFTGFSVHVTDMAGMPTYSTSYFESSLAKSPGNVSNTLALTTGFLQIPYHQEHWGLYYYSQGGVVKFDAATLGTINGGGGLYIDVGGLATKDKFHIWLSGGPRQLSIAGLQNKPDYLIGLTTVLSRQ